MPVNPIGSEFLVNTTIAKPQQKSSVAIDSDGDFVVTWQSYGQDDAEYGIYAQRYNAAGVPQGSEFRVNTTTIFYQAASSVAIDNDGDFVVTWSSYGQDGSKDGIYAQRYNALGIAQGGEFRVNTYTTNNQRNSSVAMDSDGDFVVTWQSYQQDGYGSGIYAQRYNAAGMAQGSEFLVNTTTISVQESSSVAMDSDGNFVVTWYSFGQDGSSYGIYAQRYNAAGVAQGNEFRVNTYTIDRQAFPSVAMDNDGDFVVTWNSNGQDGDGEGIYAQRYNAAGVAQGSEFRVNDTTTNNQESSSVAMDSDGNFIVTWNSFGQDGEGDGIYAQYYNAAGAAQGSEFRVNTTTTSSQSFSSVAIDRDGDLVITWNSYGQDGDGYGIYAQRYSIPVNNAPVLIDTSLALVVNEDAGTPVNGTTVGTLISDLVSLGSNVTDSDLGALTGVAITAADTSNGTWHFSTDDGTTWNLLGAVSNASARLLAADANTRIYFQPAPNYDGSIATALTFHAWDTITGITGGRADTSTNGGLTAFSTATDTVSIAIAPTNDAPTISGTPGTAIDEDILYSFTPTTVDVDTNSTLTFTITNKPTWATFDSATGTLSGTPVRSDTGTTTGVVISVSDGVAPPVNLPGFDLLVTNTNDATPVGSEFRVNTYTTHRQENSSVAIDSDGDFVVTWDSYGQDGANSGVYAQRYNAAGVAQGSEFRVNTTTISDQGRSSVAMDSDGDFIVTWNSYLQDGSSFGIYAQRYNAAGVAQGSEFRVNTFTTNRQWRPSMAMDSDGDFVVTWDSVLQDGSIVGIYAQRYNAAGVTQGSEFRVNTTTTDNQHNPGVAMDSDGDFVVTWSSYEQDGSGFGIYAQRYNAAGVTQGSEFRVNTFTTNSQQNPGVAMDSDGDFVVTWSSYEQDGSGFGIYAQRYNAAGVAQGSEFRVNTFTTSSQRFSSVAMGSDGDFVVTWESSEQDGSSSGIYTQRYNAAGVAQGSEFRVNSYTDSRQLGSSVAMDSNGDFVVTWNSYGQDGDREGIYAQRYNGAVANNAPALIDTSLTLTAVNEDAGAPVNGTAVGNLVSNLVTIGGNVTDVDSGAVTGIAITAADTTNGTWFYTINNGGTWTALGTVSNASARLLAANASTRVYFQPNLNDNGSIANAITFRAWDTSTGTNGGTADASINGGATAFSTATDTASIAINPINDAPVGLPTIAGTATEDQTLTTDSSGITDADGLGAFSYQWQSSPDGTIWTNITGATAMTVVVRNDQVGQQVRVNVSYTDGQGTAESINSAATAAIANLNDTPTGLPTLTGTPTEDQTLTADATAIADTDGLGAFSYQWQSSPNGTTWTNITGATATTFVLGDAQVGQQVRVNIAYTDGKGTAESINSAATTAIANLNDAPVGLPTIAGTPTEDQTLTASASGITDNDGLGTFSYQWQASPNGTTWTNIMGATLTTFVLGDAQVGNQVRVNVSYTDGKGTLESINSTATAAIANLNDAPTGLPTLTGTTTEDQTLTANAAAIADADGLGAFSYQWQSSPNGTTWTNITGATATTFVLGDAQVDKQVRVNVSYTDGKGTAESINSTATTAIANLNDISAGLPTITGTATENQTLTANSSSITDADGLSTFNYQWQSSLDGTTWTSITGATATTFVLGDNQVGKQVRVNVTYTDGQGTPESINSSATAAIANVNDIPTGLPTIAGTATEDQTLTATASSITDDDGLGTFSYQWQSSPNGTTWTNITGATATTFVLGDNQVGQQVRVNVSYTDGKGTAESINSGATTAIANLNDAPAGVPAIAGTATEDQMLTVAASGITDNDGLGAFSYQWQSSPNGTTWTNITGATLTTFVLGDAQVAQQVRVNVSYTDGKGTLESINSTATAAIANVNDVPTDIPTVAGTATEDQILTANTSGITDDDGLGALSYQWQSSPNGTTWTNITGATATTFVLGDAQVDKKVRVNVSYTDGKGTLESLNSAATAAIANVNDMPTGIPTIAGTATEDQTLTADATAIADIDGLGTLSYQWQSAPNGTTWTNITGATATTFVLGDNQVGQQVRVNVSYTDGEGTAESVNSAATTAIANVNDAPTVATAIADQAATEDTLFTFAVPANSFTDVDAGDTLTYTATQADNTPLPSWLTFNPTNQTFSGTPANADIGNFDLKVTARDLANAMAEDIFSLTTANFNTPPTVTNAIADQLATEDTLFTFPVPANTFSDVDAGDILTYTATQADDTPLPSWLTFNSISQTFSGTPLNAQVGSLNVKLKATDTGLLTAEDTFIVNIANTNDAPTVANAIADQAATEDAPFTFIVPVNTFTEVDAGDTLTYSATLGNSAPLPTWLTFNPTTRTFSGTPRNANVGNLDLKVKATDGAGAIAEDVFTVRVANVNQPPVIGTPITPTPQPVTATQPFTFNIPTGAFTDPDAGDTLTFSATLDNGAPPPSWLRLDAKTGVFNGVPDFLSVGDLSLKVNATDAQGSKTSQVLRLAIANPTGMTGTPTDPINFSGGKKGVTLKAQEGKPLRGTSLSDILKGTKGNDRISSGKSGDGLSKDKLYGFNGNDRLKAGGGNDYVDGGRGDDVLEGGKGRDLLLGGDGNDRILGDNGDDILVGGNGDDTLLGGDGRDMFAFANINEGKDAIADFSPTEDVIDLRSLFAQPQFAGATPYVRYLQYVQLTQVGASTEIKIDADGSGVGNTFATLVTLNNVGIGAVGSRNFVIS